MYDNLIKKAITYGLNEDSCPLGQMLIGKIRFGDQQSVQWLQQLIAEYEDKRFEGEIDIFSPFRPEIKWAGGDLPLFTSAEKLTSVALDSKHLDKGMVVASATGVGKSTVLKLLGEKLPACLIISEKNDGLFPQMQTNPHCIYVGCTDEIPDPFTSLSGAVLAGLIRTVLERHDSAVLFQKIHERLKNPTLTNIISYLEDPEKRMLKLFRKDLFMSLYASLYELHTDALGASLAQNKPMSKIPDHCFVCTALCSKKSGAFYTAALMEMVKAQKEQAQDAGMHAIIIDEASELVQDKYNAPSPISQFIRMARGSNIPVILGAHSLQVFNPIILSNVFTTLILRTVNDKDVAQAGRLASLSRAQQDVIPQLPIGHGILRVANVSQPVIVTWEHVPPGTPKQLTRLPQFVGISKTVQQVNPSLGSLAPLPATTNNKNESPLQPPVEIELLSAIQACPYMGLTQLCKIKGWSWRYKKPELERLVQQKLVEVLPFHMLDRGKPPQWMFLTEDGYKMRGIPKPTTRGGTGIKHVLIQTWVKDTLHNAGFSAELEVYRDQKSVDVGCGKPGNLTVAVEVCLTTQVTESIQAEQDLHSWKHVIILCPNKTVLLRLEKELIKNAVDTARVCAVLPKDLVRIAHEKITV
jgi:hypothetical protein